jgi:hypothetical protein
MAYTNADARQQLLDVLADAADEIAHALAALGEAYELLDEHAADLLEAAMFRPVQHAYGRAQRTHVEFADRYELPRRTFEGQSAGLPSLGAKGFVEVAVEACTRADGALATLQDSMLPVEVGDADVRAGISEVRELLGGVRARARELLRTFGR